MNQTPEIKVGIQVNPSIELTLVGQFRHTSGIELSGKYTVTPHGQSMLLFKADDGEDVYIRSGLCFKPLDEKSFFTIHKVTIGVDFHWERQEDQSFKGSFQLLLNDGVINAINILPLEDYLMSVISSEMSATSSIELLKAHAVISRSWLLAQIDKSKSLVADASKYQTVFESEDEYIKWYDREDHTHFDVCADDHCQRYQGMVKANTPEVEQAVAATRGEVLMYNNAICDARFSKCCGGMVEKFENVWEPVKHPYLQSFVDDASSIQLNLKEEGSACEWINGEPDAFCNTNDKEVLKQVLNDYDQETNDFYRWELRYDQNELSELVAKRTGVDYGTIQDLIPIERGDSGRLIKLKIVGDKKTLTIGKELEIRKTLSESHLYSSAFVITKSEEQGTVFFTLRGAGWGHGVGLCQIGAAVMGAKGYDYNAILNHYFRGAELKQKY